jgi:hypothetical protein
MKVKVERVRVAEVPAVLGDVYRAHGEDSIMFYMLGERQGGGFQMTCLNSGVAVVETDLETINDVRRYLNGERPRWTHIPNAKLVIPKEGA